MADFPQQRQSISAVEIVQVFNDIETARKTLHELNRQLAEWLEISAEFRREYLRWRSRGGLSGRNFIDHLEGRWKPKPARGRGGIRLIVDNQSLRPRPGRDEPPEAA
jgi:hypothetical protein